MEIGDNMIETGYLAGLVVGLIAGFATGMLYSRKKGPMTRKERNQYMMVVAAGVLIAFIGIVALIVMTAGLI